MTRIVVDLPAPFGPTKPVTWPSRTANVIPSSACAAPNRLRSPATSIAASMLDEARSRRDGSRHAGEPSWASSFRVTFPGRPPLRVMAGIPGPGDAPGLGCGDNDSMATGWAQRITAAPHSLTTVGVVLGLAAFGQAIARALTLATAHTVQVTSPGPAAEAALYAVPLCLLALATTVPLIFLRPAAAAVAITAASTVSLTVFGSGALTEIG